MDNNNKQKIQEHIQGLVDANLIEAKESMSLLIEAKEKETKSSAGDKFETAREMIQTEINKCEDQIKKFLS